MQNKQQCQGGSARQQWEGEKILNKSILSDYIDACKLLKETEEDIRRLKKKRNMITQTNVRGSNPEFPYQQQHFQIEGIAFTYSDDKQLRMEEMLLEERKRRAEKVKVETEAWMNTIPIRMQRIIRNKFFEGLSWEQVARRMKNSVTADSVRKEFERFMENN